MSSDAPVSRWILQHAPLDALAPNTAQMLTRLGYRIVLPDDFAGEREREPGLVPDLLLVDERRLAETVAREGGDAAPIVLLCGRQGASGSDGRVVGAAKRPAGLHDLYRLFQQIFEDTPRTTPRIATQLRARCAGPDAGFEARVVSLSENGCLLRSPEPILLGQKLALELELPHQEALRVEAEATYQLLPDTGLVFHAVAPPARAALAGFVEQALMSA